MSMVAWSATDRRLESPFLYLPHDTVEPCFLAKMDLDDVARRLAPRPLKLDGLINGLNLTVDQTTLAASYRQTTAAYQTKAGLLQMQVQRLDGCGDRGLVLSRQSDLADMPTVEARGRRAKSKTSAS